MKDNVRNECCHLRLDSATIGIDSENEYNPDQRHGGQEWGCARFFCFFLKRIAPGKRRTGIGGSGLDYKA